MSTEPLFRTAPYETVFDAQIVGIEDGAVVLDRTLFYPQGGGQPGDVGELVLTDGRRIPVVDTRHGEDGEVHHVAADGTELSMMPGTRVRGTIDWRVRYPRMRVHTCLHLLSVVIPAPVTGGAISDGRGRLDFDLPESTLDRDTVTAGLERLIDADYPVTTEWISEAELEARPELVKTMSVAPPHGGGEIRLVRIGDIDLQPCGGTHVASTAEIGRVAVTRIEKKSRHNRRVVVALEET